MADITTCEFIEAIDLKVVIFESCSYKNEISFLLFKNVVHRIIIKKKKIS